MKYSHDYYILCRGPEMKNEIRNVKGTKIMYGFKEYAGEYGRLPKLFIYKDRAKYILSDAMSGMKIWESWNVKGIKEWADDGSIQKMIVERYNEPALDKYIQEFCNLVNAQN